MDELSGRDELIYDLIFSERTEFDIDLSDYLIDIYNYLDFTKEVKSIVRKSGIKITHDKITVDSITAIWELKLIK